MRSKWAGSMRRIVISLAAAAALAGCATAPSTPYTRPVTTMISPPVSNVPNIYTNASRAPLHSELFACNSYGSNLGLIGLRGEFASASVAHKWQSEFRNFAC